jgi:hypothetical protein
MIWRSDLVDAVYKEKQLENVCVLRIGGSQMMIIKE